MCWTIRVPAPSGAGSAGSSSASARGPPVEEAMTTARGAPPPGAADGAARRTAWPSAACAGAAARPAPRGDRLRAGVSARFSVKASKRLADGRLGDEVERALGQRVDRAGAVGGREGADDDDRHGGRAALRRARSTPRPSRPGMARSSVMASGRVARHSASASSPSRGRARPPRSRRRSARRPRTRRMNAGVVGDDDAGGGGASGVARRRLSAAELPNRPAGAEQDDQAVVDLGDRVDRGLVGRGDGSRAGRRRP